MNRTAAAFAYSSKRAKARELTQRDIERFPAYYQAVASGCWEWLGGTFHGYGVFSASGKQSIRAHRVAFFLHYGHWPDCIDHLCRNRKCVNPLHLEAVSNKENVLRGIGITAKNRLKTHCSKGHELTDSNVWMSARGQRICKTCSGKSSALTHARQRLERRLKRHEQRAG